MNDTTLPDVSATKYHLGKRPLGPVEVHSVALLIGAVAIAAFPILFGNWVVGRKIYFRGLDFVEEKPVSFAGAHVFRALGTLRGRIIKTGYCQTVSHSVTMHVGGFLVQKGPREKVCAENLSDPGCFGLSIRRRYSAFRRMVNGRSLAPPVYQDALGYF